MSTNELNSFIRTQFTFVVVRRFVNIHDAIPLCAFRASNCFHVGSSDGSTARRVGQGPFAGRAAPYRSPFGLQNINKPYKLLQTAALIVCCAEPR